MSDRIACPSAPHETHCTAEQYDALYARSIEDSDGFWLDQAKRLDWERSSYKKNTGANHPVF